MPWSKVQILVRPSTVLYNIDIMNTIQRQIAWNSTSKDKVLLSAMEYFLSRKKEIERYVEGEHKWYGCLDSSREITYNSSPRPWYLETHTCSKTE